MCTATLKARRWTLRFVWKAERLWLRSVIMVAGFPRGNFTMSFWSLQRRRIDGLAGAHSSPGRPV